MTTTTQQAEQLWVSAHEHVRRGDFASATRDLAACFQILQEHNDPRLPEVHRRWTEVHQLAVEEATQGRAQPQPAAAQQAAPNLEAEAEAAANAGDLDGAIALYEVALARSPSNELIAERLLELRNARPRAAELTSSTPPVEASGPTPALIDDEALAASIDVGADHGDVDVGVAVGSEVDVDAPTLVSARPAATIVRDEAVEASIPVEPIDDDAAFNAGLDAGFDDGIHEAVTLVPARSAEPSLEPQAASSSSSIPQWGSDLMSTTSEAPISGEDPRWGSVDARVEAPIETIELPALPEPEAPSVAAAASIDDELSFADVITLPPQPAPAVVEEPVVSTVATIEPVETFEAVDAIEPAAPIAASEQITGDDPRWAEAAPSTSTEQITGDDPRWGEASPSTSLPATEQITGDDARQGEASTPAATDQITGDDPRWGGGVSAPLSGDDPRWGTPTTAPLMAAEDAPVGMPSLDIAIDTGMSVSGSEADELPVEISDDLVMLDDEAAALTTVPPQPAEPIAAAAPVVAAASSLASSSSSDDLPADPVSLLEALLLRVRDNRRAA